MTPLTEGKKEVPHGTMGEILEKQLSLLDDMVHGVEYGTKFVKSRIIGIADTPADSGEEFDITLGRYE